MTGLECLRALVLSLVAGGLLFQQVPCPAGAAGNPVPVLSIMLKNSEQQANVSDSEQCTVRLDGAVFVDKLPVCRSVVTLMAFMDIGWKLDIAPSTMIFGSSTPQDFTVTVIVPRGTPGNLSRTLTILGKFSVGGYGYECLGKTAATITVAPYFGVRLEPKTPISVSGPGDGTSVELRIRNAGNVNDSYGLEISNLIDLSDHHWRVTISNNTVRNVGPGQSRTIEVHARFEPDRLNPFESLWSASVLVTSQNAKDYQQVIRGNLSLVMYVKPGLTYVICPTVIILAAAVAAACFAISVRDWLRDRRSKALMVEPQHET